MRLLLIGFGVVGQGLVEILRDKADLLREEYGFEPKVVGVITRTRGILYRPEGLNLDKLLHAIETSLNYYTEEPGLERGDDALTLIGRCGADVMVESTYTNFEDAQPALDYVRAALTAGMNVVLANKGPVALAYEELMALAADKGKTLLFEGTVMAGTPSLRLGMQALAGCTIHAARGILNGTTNFMLTQMETGMSYAEALARAQELGYAEADPTADVDGWDAAGKAVILAAALFQKTFKITDFEVRGIRDLTPEDIEAARMVGERYKLIAHVTPDGGSITPQRLPLSHPLSGVSGATNAVTFSTDLLGDVTLIGAGAGRLQTGFALLSDLLDLHRRIQ